MTLLDKLTPLVDRIGAFGTGPIPFNTVIDSVISPTEVVVNGRRTLMCGSNNYFGLSFHPDVIHAARQALEQQGSATTGSRAANGTFTAHRALEEAFRDFYGMRHAIVFTTGYQANVGVISALCGADDTILLDLESHASIYDGARLSGAQVFTFRHNSVADLERKLARMPDATRCLVIIEGLYSISGDVAPVAAIVDVCRARGAFLMVDEAHSFGVYGATGLGVTQADNALDRVDVIVGTFSKALAGVGGFAVSNHSTLDLLHFASRPYVFTASGSPANIAGVDAALRVLRREPEMRDRLWQVIRRMRAALAQAGFDLNPTESPIVSIRIGSPERTVSMWRLLLDAGVYVNLVLPPACPADACLLRSSYSAAHTDADVDRAAACFKEAGTALRVIGVLA